MTQYKKEKSTLKEYRGADINGRDVSISSLQVGGIRAHDHPRFDNAYFAAGEYSDGESLSGEELEYLTDNFYWLLNELALSQYHDRVPDNHKDAGLLDENHDEFFELRRLAGLPMLESDSPQFAKGDRVQVKDHVQRWGGKSGKITVAQGKHYMVKVDRARSGEVEFLGSELTKAADVKVDEARSDSWSRKINKILGWDLTSPREIQQRVRGLDDSTLKQLYTLLPSRAGASSGSERNLQLKIIDQEMKRRHGLTPKGNIRESEEMVTKATDEKVDESRLSYDEFTGAGKESWDITFSYGAGKGGRQTSRRTMVGIEPGSSEQDVAKIWNKRHPGKKFISAKKRTSEIREGEEMVTKRVVGHEDREARMMQRELLKIRDYAQELCDMLDNLQDGDFPHWWQAKLVKAGDYMSTIKHFLEGELELDSRGDSGIDRISVDPIAQDLLSLDGINEDEDDSVGFDEVDPELSFNVDDVNMASMSWMDVNYDDPADQVDAFVDHAEFHDGTLLTDEELDELNNVRDFVEELAQEHALSQAAY